MQVLWSRFSGNRSFSGGRRNSQACVWIAFEVFDLADKRVAGALD
jgi:hypothetical protein